MRFWFLSLAFGFFLAAKPVFADIDYTCLNTCVAAGNTHSACMASCTYNQAVKKQKPSEKSFSRKVLDTPVPVATGTVLIGRPSRAAPPLDHTCMRQCLGTHVRYAFCEQRCGRR